MNTFLNEGSKQLWKKINDEKGKIDRSVFAFLPQKDKPPSRRKIGRWYLVVNRVSDSLRGQKFFLFFFFFLLIFYSSDTHVFPLPVKSTIRQTPIFFSWFSFFQSNLLLVVHPFFSLICKSSIRLIPIFFIFESNLLFVQHPFFFLILILLI